MNRWLGMCALAAVIAMSGCVSRHVDRNSIQGRPIERSAFARIDKGSSAGWTLSVMGEPTRKITAGDNREVWEWSYEESKSVRGQLLVFSNESLVVNRKVARVELKDGVVINKWLDDSDTIVRDKLN